MVADTVTRTYRKLTRDRAEIWGYRRKSIHILRGSRLVLPQRCGGNSILQRRRETRRSRKVSSVAFTSSASVLFFDVAMPPGWSPVSVPMYGPQGSAPAAPAQTGIVGGQGAAFAHAKWNMLLINGRIIVCGNTRLSKIRLNYIVNHHVSKVRKQKAQPTVIRSWRKNAHPDKTLHRMTTHGSRVCVRQNTDV